MSLLGKSSRKNPVGRLDETESLHEKSRPRCHSSRLVDGQWKNFKVFWPDAFGLSIISLNSLGPVIEEERLPERSIAVSKGYLKNYHEEDGFKDELLMNLLNLY